MTTKVVVKFGGSSIRFEKKPKNIEDLIERPENFIRYDEIKRYAKEMSIALKRRKMTLLVFHGVKQYGHIAADY
jgi:isopentenyl phosphate kinase